MVSTLTNTTFSTSYKDDYTDSNRYNRILFNSGKALQARELTQMQTILQKQIERIGNNIFKEGAVVKPGGFNVNNGYEFIKLDESVYTLDAAGIDNVIDATFIGGTSTIKVKVIEAIASSGADPATLFISYIDTSGVTNPTSPRDLRVTAGETLTSGAMTLVVQTTDTSANPAVGTGTQINVNSGIYYTKGHFVFTEDQKNIVSKYTDTYTGKVGFKVEEQVITADDDAALYDNQGTTPNISAPGADRYRINLTITDSDGSATSENFVPICEVLNGVVVSLSKEYEGYNIPQKVTARRIKENSGDYIVKPFLIEFDEDSATTHLRLKISDGIIVHKGFRSAHASTEIRVLKPTSTITQSDEVISTDFGNYVKVDYTANATTGLVNAKGLPGTSTNQHTFELLNLRDDSAYGGSTIGTAHVRGITEEGDILKYHLQDIRMTPGNAFRKTQSIGTSSSNFFNIIQENNVTELYSPTNASLLFKLPNIRPKTVTIKDLTIQERYTGTPNGSGNLTVNTSPDGTFTNTGDWVVVNDSAPMMIPNFAVSLSGSGPTNKTATFSGLKPSTAVEILTYVQRTSGGSGVAGVRSKTLANGSTNRQINIDPNGTSYIKLGQPDIFELTNVYANTDSANDIKEHFTLDDGQRDGYYGHGRIVLKSGFADPGACQVNFKYFTHGGAGDCFAVNSYTGQVNYDEIPKFRKSNGRIINLRNFLDFRSVKDSAYDGAFSGSTHKLPQPTDTITADVEYYQSQFKNLTIDTKSNLRLISGTPNLAPNPPETPDDNFLLYKIKMMANTLNDSDMVLIKNHAKRYTMKDIGVLERRIGYLEDVAALTMLEQDTKNFPVYDSSGNDRTKSGIFFDNFKDHISSSSTDINYTASLNPIAQTLHPAYRQNNITLLYDSAQSTNTKKLGDNVYIIHDDDLYLDASEASQHTQINPFNAIVFSGHVDLSPATDDWFDEEGRTRTLMSGGTILNTDQALLWGSHDWNWVGGNIEDLVVGDATNIVTESLSTKNVVTHNKISEEKTVREVVGERQFVERINAPFMRSRKIYFRVSGMRPNSRLFCFMDGISMTNYVRAEAFQQFSDQDASYGNIGKYYTNHPEGSSTLVTDANGTEEGSLWIPYQTFRTGTKTITFQDMTVSPDGSKALSLAKIDYTASGLIDVYEEDIRTTRELIVTGVQEVHWKNTSSGGGGGGNSVHVQEDNDGGSPPSSPPDVMATGPETFGSWSGMVADETANYGGSDDAGGDGGGAGGEAGDDSGKIICTMLNDFYGFGSYRNKIWLAYSNKYLILEHQLGYHKIFVPLVEKAKNNDIVYNIISNLARNRTAYLYKKMKSKNKWKTLVENPKLAISSYLIEWPSYFVGKLIKLGLIKEIDHSRLYKRN